jgi:hypothetical protein
MAEKLDWATIRSRAFSDAATPADWPRRVHSISMEGLNLLGVDDQYQLYWDGKPIEIKRTLSLSIWQRVGAVTITLSAAAGAMVEVARFVIERGH